MDLILLLDASFKNLDIRLFLFEKIPRSTERHLINISSERSGHVSFVLFSF